ncbi:Hypothetical protein D9617_47g010780 [Elsinoe fawcettii]|nr:Hypothetical protein D9617_47g010780 [Elsinoe fawcettii]
MAMLHDAGYRPDEIGQIMQKATSVKGYSDAEFRADLAKRQTRPGISVEQAIDVRTATMRTLGRAQYDQYEIAGIMNQVDFCLWEMKSANRGDGNGDFDRNLRPTQQKLDGMEGAEAGVRETLRIAGYSTGQIDRMLARSEEVVKAEKKTDDKMRRQLLEEGYAQAEINRAMTFDRPSRDQDEQMVKLLWRAGYNMDQIDSILRRAEIRVKIRSQVGVR